MSKRKRAWLRIDRLAFPDIVRDHLLSAPEQCLLLHLVLLADWRSWEWRGTQTDLAQLAGVGRNTAARALARLVDLGLIRVSAPFARGGEGAVRVDAYDRLVVQEPRGWTTTALAASDLDRASARN